VPNFDQRWSWFSDLGVSYHVGFYGFSFWLAGLAVVVMAAAIAYGFWVGRDRPSAYFGLMLFLTSATVGVFASQDLLLFYVFFEAMMIPLYLLIGVWGGPGRLGATVKFVIYTMAGSLLMLASVIVFGLSAGSFDLVTTGTSDSTWVFLGFLVAFAIKAPLFPLHGWLPDAYRESSPEVAAVLSGSRRPRSSASSGSACSSSPSRSTTSACSCSHSRRPGSSTGRCWPSARRMFAA
jgi:NADH-quinone oxidoreductase subunit M